MEFKALNISCFILQLIDTQEDGTTESGKSGVEDAKKLHTYISDNKSGETKWLVDGSQKGEVVWASSNLLRAQQTLAHACGDLIQSAPKKYRKVYVISDLQECKAGADAGNNSVAPAITRHFLPSCVFSRTFKRMFDTPNVRVDHQYDYGNNQSRLLPYTSGYRANGSLKTFFQLKTKQSKEGVSANTFVYAGHSGQIKQTMKYLVGKIDEETWFEEDNKRNGVWAAKDKLDNGGAMEFVVEKTGCCLFESHKIVAGTWKQFGETGLQREKLNAARTPDDQSNSIREEEGRISNPQDGES